VESIEVENAEEDIAQFGKLLKISYPLYRASWKTARISIRTDMRLLDRGEWDDYVAGLRLFDPLSPKLCLRPRVRPFLTAVVQHKKYK
jgi:hypothetical protein